MDQTCNKLYNLLLALLIVAFLVFPLLDRQLTGFALTSAILPPSIYIDTWTEGLGNAMMELYSGKIGNSIATNPIAAGLVVFLLAQLALRIFFISRPALLPQDLVQQVLAFASMNVILGTL